nr:elongation of very long chain fatty acids protein 4-like [Halyomorpha halys]
MSCLNVTYSVPEEVSNERIIMAGLVKMALDEYTSIIDRISDPRVEDWPLMDSPFPTLFMVGAYLYFVVFLGPKMMENRKPFKLNSILVVYNAAQTLFSLIMFSEKKEGYFLGKNTTSYNLLVPKNYYKLIVEERRKKHNGRNKSEAKKVGLMMKPILGLFGFTSALKDSRLSPPFG